MTTEAPSALTIKTFQAYLDPLLKKHESRKVIMYEDLLASWEAAEAVLADNRSSPDVSIVVSVFASGWLIRLRVVFPANA